MSTVIAAHVRSCDPPQLIAEDILGVMGKVGTEVGLEQCDACGNSLYVVCWDNKFELDKVQRLQVAGAFYVECVPDTKFWEDNGLEIPEGVGCGTQYRLRWYDESEVCF